MSSRPRWLLSTHAFLVYTSKKLRIFPHFRNHFELLLFELKTLKHVLLALQFHHVGRYWADSITCGEFVQWKLRFPKVHDLCSQILLRPHLLRVCNIFTNGSLLMLNIFVVTFEEAVTLQIRWHFWRLLLLLCNFQEIHFYLD